jgi:membrane fusion protein (multidrug efflux system)
MNRRALIGSVLLLVAVFAVAGGLAALKWAAIQEDNAAAASQTEPMESVTAAIAQEREHRQTTTSIGTVLALRSISLRNEVPGTVHEVMLEPGQVVEEGTLLVALDVSVEEAELKAQEAQAALAETLLGRVQRASQNQAVSEIEVDRARAERDVALAQIARIKAIIDRKTIRAPFRARVGMADVHTGQYLEAGTLLTTLQGVDDAANVDFTVAQQVASGLREGDSVAIVAQGEQSGSVSARIIAIDSRVDPATRNAMVRARIGQTPSPVEGEGWGGGEAHNDHDRSTHPLTPSLSGRGKMPAPGASVRVRVPVGPPGTAVVIPASALRKGPAGDHVFVLEAESDGATRAHVRAVQSGAMLDDEVVIHAGLAAGEQLAASGSFKLREGALVVIANAAPAVASNIK